MTNTTGLIMLLSGCVVGWTLRWPQVERLEQRCDELLDDLDAAVRDISATLGRRNHPAGTALHQPPRRLRSVR